VNLRRIFQHMSRLFTFGLLSVICLSDLYKAQFVQFARCMKSPAFRENVEKSLEAETVRCQLIFVLTWHRV